MKYIWMVILAIVGIGQEGFAQPLKVMTWNIRYDNPADGVNGWPNRKDWLAEIVVQSKADIAGFQEVLVGQFDDLRTRLPEMQSYGVGRDDGKNAGEFCPIFYRRDRFELVEKSTFWLSPTPEVTASKGWDAALPRIASWVKLKDQSGVEFYVINTHFDHRGKQAREESARLLVQRLGETFADHPVVLLGDFNTTANSPPYDVLVGQGRRERGPFFDTYAHSAKKPQGPNSTWNGFKAIVPDHRIDFVFTTKSVKTQQLRILDDQRDKRFPSDHLPVVTELIVAP